MHLLRNDAPAGDAVDQQVVLNLELQRHVELHLLMLQQLVQLKTWRSEHDDAAHDHSTSFNVSYFLGLGHSAGEAIQQKAVLALGRVDVLLDQVHHNFVADELPDIRRAT